MDSCDVNNNWCVYVHINKTNNKKYIGITCYSDDVNRRWRNGYGYREQVFFKAIQKYGWDGFKHIVLYKNFTREQAVWKEKLLIHLFKTNTHKKGSHGYNCSDGGDGCCGHVMSEEARERDRIAHLRENLSEDALRKMSEARLGKPAWNSGKKMTEEWKQKHNIYEVNRSHAWGTSSNPNPRSVKIEYNKKIYESMSECWRENFQGQVSYDYFKTLVRKEMVKEKLGLETDVIKVNKEN